MDKISTIDADKVNESRNIGPENRRSYPVNIDTATSTEYW